MATLRALFAALAFSALAVPLAAQDATAAAPTAARDDTAAEKLGWQLGVQAWTFRDRTAFEAIDTAHALGLRYIELFPGQKLGPDSGDAKVATDMKPELRQALQAKLAAAGVKALAFGVCGMSKDEAEARKTFEFAKAMGLASISCEPDPDAWDAAGKLADEYGIRVACHNHPKPSHYWNPQTVLDAVKDRSPQLGSCSDTGHWPRSGIDAVQALHLLAGRIRSLHFKDIAPADAKGEDKPWGTGKGKAHEMLAELHRQGFRGLISIEYETGAGAELEANVRKCIAFFDDEARAFAAADAKKGAVPGK